MKTAITTAGAAILLILISMESGARGNPYPTSIAEDEGVMMPLLRQRRAATLAPAVWGRTATSGTRAAPNMVTAEPERAVTARPQNLTIVLVTLG